MKRMRRARGVRDVAKAFGVSIRTVQRALIMRRRARRRKIAPALGAMTD